MNEINKYEVINLFNTLRGARYSAGTKALERRFEKLENAGITTEQLLNYVRNSHERNLYHQLKIENVLRFIQRDKVETEELTEVKVVPERSYENEGEAKMALGLIEKALAKVMVEEYAPKLAEEVQERVDKYIEDNYGKVQRKVEFIIPERDVEFEDVTHEKFETVLNFVLADEPVMLVGPAGTGKNVICKQIAEAMKLDFYFSNAITQEYKLTGFIDANGSYHETQFYKAFKYGGVFMLDEMDASIPEVLIILNAAIANRYFDFPTGKVEAHEDFRLIAAANTFGTGASYVYSGRNQLDGASLDRFAVVEINYSETIENSLTDDDDLLKFVRKFRKTCEENGINHIVSYRAITRLHKLKDAMQLDELLKYCLLKNLEGDDLNMIINKFKLEDNCDRWSEALRKVEI